jgi:hypothetical protein
MLGQIRIVVRDTPLQFMASVAVVSVFDEDRVSTLVNVIGDMLKLQDCASAAAGVAVAMRTANSRRIIGKLHP